jgi:hypothetical protein
VKPGVLTQLSFIHNRVKITGISVDGAVVGGRFTLAHLTWSNKRLGNGQCEP